MAMTYRFTAIGDGEIPKTAFPFARHMVETYASETNKVVSVWREFADGDLEFRVHPRAGSVGEILKHQLLSERRFFGEFLGTPEPPPADVLPADASVAACTERLVELARPRLRFLAEQSEAWWLEVVPFFEVERARAWVFWRRVLHTAHHRTQLTVCLRVMGRAVPATYGPTADDTWAGADPTHSVDAAGRR
ncbi:MAG: DinB family protein [Gemmatimonadetes bacterium]|nr:DinB family protein [Gemmatimonadota bacterium]